MEDATQEELLEYKQEIESSLASAEIIDDYYYWKDQLWSVEVALRLYYP